MQDLLHWSLKELVSLISFDNPAGKGYDYLVPGGEYMIDRIKKTVGFLSQGHVSTRRQPEVD